MSATILSTAGQTGEKSLMIPDSSPRAFAIPPSSNETLIFTLPPRRQRRDVRLPHPGGRGVPPAVPHVERVPRLHALLPVLPGDLQEVVRPLLRLLRDGLLLEEEPARHPLRPAYRLLLEREVPCEVQGAVLQARLRPRDVVRLLELARRHLQRLV